MGGRAATDGACDLGGVELMGYVAVKGGTEAIAQAAELVRYFRVRGGSAPLQVEQLRDQMRLLVDRVMSEGSLYSPFHAALALKQAEGDSFEAAFLLRAYRSTVPRTRDSLVVDTAEMDVVRRISAAFQEIPGGQILGPTRDYTQRLLEFELAEESEEHVRRFLETYLAEATSRPGAPTARFPKVIEMLRREGMIHLPTGGVAPGAVPDAAAEGAASVEAEPYDITRHPLTFPAPRSARLQALARGETGGLLALAYSSMRGYGDVHPTIGELRVGFVPLRVRHPDREKTVLVGRVMVTEAEVIARFTATGRETGPRFTIGYGLCFGHNELKAIAMAVLDRAMNEPVAKSPAEDEEFVLYHVDGIESSGFAAHYKLPHYVTFQADVDRLTAARRRAGRAGSAAAEVGGVGTPEMEGVTVSADR